MAKKKQKKKRNGGNMFTQGPGESASSYNGPIEPPLIRKQVDTGIRLLADVNAITTGGTGVENTVHSSNPTGMTQWASMSGQWDEYRVLAMEWHYVPLNRYNQTLSVAYAASIGHLWTCLDLNSSTAISSDQAAGEFASAEFGSASDPHKRAIKAQGRELMSWNDTNNAPTYQMSIKTRFDHCNASTVLGYYWIRRLIQFRGTI